MASSRLALVLARRVGAGGRGGEPAGSPGQRLPSLPAPLTPWPLFLSALAIAVWYRIFSNGVWGLWEVGAVEKLACLAPRFSLALPDDLRSPIRAEREELRNLHFFPPEYGGESLSRSQASDLLAHQTDQPCLAFSVSEVNDGTAVDIFSFGMCALEVLSTLLIASAPGSPSSCHFQFVPAPRWQYWRSKPMGIPESQKRPLLEPGTH